MTSTRSAAVRAISVNTSASCSHMAYVMALRRSGRLSVRVTIPSARSTRIGSMAGEPSPPGEPTTTRCQVHPFQARKRYVCPGCQQEIPPGVGHVVVVPHRRPGPPPALAPPVLGARAPAPTGPLSGRPRACRRRAQRRPRSRQRSSTSSMPTDRRSSPGGSACSPAQRPRRSIRVSTPPRLVPAVDQADRSHHGLGRGCPAGHVEGDHGAEAAHLAGGQVVARVVGQTRIADPAPPPGGRPAAGPARPALAWARSRRTARVRIPARPARLPTVRRWRRAANAARPAPRTTSGRRRHGRAQHHVGVAGQQLGGAVDHHIGPEVERALQQRGGEGVVDGHVHAELVGAVDQRGQVGHGQQRVGRRLQPEQPVRRRTGRARPTAVRAPRPPRRTRPGWRRCRRRRRCGSAAGPGRPRRSRKRRVPL